MKKFTLCLLIGALAATAVFTGCSVSKKSDNSGKSAVAAASVAEATEPEVTETLVYDNNGIKLTFTGYEEKIFPSLNFRIENSSDKSYMVTTKDVSINDCMISTSIIETVAAGKKSNTSMTMLKSDLEKNGIDDIKKVEFKLHCTNSDDILDSFDSDTITITFS